jgi:hypothetical protein
VKDINLLLTLRGQSIANADDAGRADGATNVHGNWLETRSLTTKGNQCEKPHVRKNILIQLASGGYLPLR